MESERPLKLHEAAIFQGLSANDLTELARDLTLVRYPAHRSLMTVGQPGERVFVILSGTVKVYVDNARGSEVILALLGPGEIVGEMSLLDNLGRSASVVTLEPSNVASMDRRLFWHRLNTVPQLMSNMVTRLSRRLRLADLRIQANATLDVEGRIALQLLALAQAFGETNTHGQTRIPIRLAQNELAALVGASRVRVNQIIVEYKRRGFIDIDNALRITLLDTAALQSRLDDELLDPAIAHIHP